MQSINDKNQVKTSEEQSSKTCNHFYQKDFFFPKPAARVHKKLIPTLSIAVVQNCISLKINVYLFKRECNILQNKAKKIEKII